MDFNDLSFLVIEQSLIKGLRLLFFFATHTLKPHTDFKTIQCLQKSSQQHEILHAKTANQDLFRFFFFRSLQRLQKAEIYRFRILQNP